MAPTPSSKHFTSAFARACTSRPQYLTTNSAVSVSPRLPPLFPASTACPRGPLACRRQRAFAPNADMWSKVKLVNVRRRRSENGLWTKNRQNWFNCRIGWASLEKCKHHPVQKESKSNYFLHSIFQPASNKPNACQMKRRQFYTADTWSKENKCVGISLKAATISTPS